MAKQAIDFLFSPYRRKVLSILLLRPEEQFHVRELGRLTGVSAGSLHRELKAMAEAGMLTRETRGNQVLYSADPSCAIYEELASIFRKTTGMHDLLADALAPLAGGIRCAFVFGSMAAGTQQLQSDIDVCVVGKVTLFDVVKALGPVGESLARETNPVVLSPAEFHKKLSNGDRFIERLMAEPKLFVFGDERELAELSQDQQA